MADNRLSEAVNIVARWVIAGVVNNYVDWSDYPELGEYDWARVIVRIDEIAGKPSGDEYEAAYEYLVTRVDNTEATP